MERDAPALAQGVEPEALVEAHDLAGLLLQERPAPGAQVLPHELAEAHLAQEADALAVAPRLIGQRCGSRQLAYLRLRSRTVPS